ncbi:MAG: M3 family metallopeptidase [Bryobacterales bacterium]|nr:M3 family metallopeptidase [Bryobacterales bacterium]
MNDNPLLRIEQRAPFDRIRTDDIEPAIEALLADAKERLEAAAEGEPTFDNTMRVYDAITERLDYAFSIVRHLESVATTPELRAVYNKVHGPVSAFYSNLPLHEGLWKAIKRYAASEEASGLTGARRRFVDKTVESFRRHGADLDPAGKERLAAIDLELAALTTKFSENVLDSTNAFELLLDEEAQLAGLPPSAIESARENAQAKGREGWRFTLQGPSYLAVMTYLDDAATREQVYRAFSVRASREPHDNRQVASRILELRREKARLLGFADFADFVLEDRMAGRGERAWEFLQDLRRRTEAAFQRENESLIEFRGAPLEPWDIGYWAEKQRKALYDFDEEVLRPYFPLEPVVAGMFDLFGRLFSIDVTQVDGVPAWDPAVRFYEIRDRQSGELLGAFYADFYPRENKRGGAWMDSLLTGQPGGLPHLGLICGNLTPPSGGKPALLTHRDVETIFHEFGHLLHHCLSRVEVRGFAGTSVAWDFVELPSQIMENWCWERESLDLFARHYETGETIPQDLFERMKRARTYRAANAQMRQLGFGVIDLALHREYDAARDGGLVAYSRRLLQQFSPAALPDDHSMVTAFTHLFSSPVGYGAGYYSYKWAEVLDADAFTRFRDAGVFSEETGRAFRETILARGDSEDPAELFRAFMGRDPDPKALLERSGLLA